MWPFNKKQNVIRSYEEYRKEEILYVLRKLKYDKNAKPIFELLAGANYWTDELPDPKIGTLFGACSIYLRQGFAYRHSLSLGTPKEKFKKAWDRIIVELPEWPGLRDDRINGRATRLAKVCERQMQRMFAQLEKEIDEEKRIGANQSVKPSP